MKHFEFSLGCFHEISNIFLAGPFTPRACNFLSYFKYRLKPVSSRSLSPSLSLSKGGRRHPCYWFLLESLVYTLVDVSIVWVMKAWDVVIKNRNLSCPCCNLDCLSPLIWSQADWDTVFEPVQLKKVKWIHECIYRQCFHSSVTQQVQFATNLGITTQ